MSETVQVIPGLYIVAHEPTVEMANAGCHYAEEALGLGDIMLDEVVGIYQSMLALAPPYRNGIPLPALPHELEREVHAAEQAAKRYAWLREHFNELVFATWDPLTSEPLEFCNGTPAELDEAIDAAMLKP